MSVTTEIVAEHSAAFDALYADYLAQPAPMEFRAWARHYGIPARTIAALEALPVFPTIEACRDAVVSLLHAGHPGSMSMGPHIVPVLFADRAPKRVAA